jgi:hypothetical protein
MFMLFLLNKSRPVAGERRHGFAVTKRGVLARLPWIAVTWLSADVLLPPPQAVEVNGAKAVPT